MTDTRSLKNADPLPPDEAVAVRDALSRAAESPAFRNAPQLVAFLTFIVEKTVSGEVGDLKGYTIATQALGRGQDFDPQSDPIVRVEAGRLRRALDAYYHDSGRDDPIRIIVPRGTYVPIFQSGSAEPITLLAGEPAVPARDEPEVLPQPTDIAPDSWLLAASRRPRIRAAAIAALVGIVGAIALGLIGSTEPALAPSRPHEAPAASSQVEGLAVLVVAPVETVGPQPARFTPNLLRDLTLDGLARFDGLAVIDRAASSRPVTRDHYTLGLRVSEMDRGLGRVSVRLTYEPTGRVIWSRELEPKGADPAGSAELDVARQIATIIGQPSGVLFSDWRARPSANAQIQCLVWAYGYLRNPNAGAHSRARTCLERELAAGFVEPLIPASLAFLYLDEHRADFNKRPDPLDRALRRAQQAIEIGPESARAYQALSAALFARGETEQGLRTGERALDLNPYDPDILADFGSRLILVGRYAEGQSLIARAAAGNSIDPPWYDFFLFLAAHMQGDAQQAFAAASRIVAGDYALGLVARAIAASHQGDAAGAAEMADRLVAVQPAYARNPREVLSRHRFTPEAVDRLASDLRRAGIKLEAPVATGSAGNGLTP